MLLIANYDLFVALNFFLCESAVLGKRVVGFNEILLVFNFEVIDYLFNAFCTLPCLFGFLLLASSIIAFLCLTFRSAVLNFLGSTVVGSLRSAVLHFCFGIFIFGWFICSTI